jgi:hypothetical protein
MTTLPALCSGMSLRALGGYRERPTMRFGWTPATTHRATAGIDQGGLMWLYAYATRERPYPTSFGARSPSHINTARPPYLLG